VLPGSRYAQAVIVIVTVLIVLGLIASAVAYPMSV
jgi:hypothetical protein